MPVANVRDLEMFYREYGLEDSEPLVLLHGFTATGQMFESLFEDLGHHFRLFTPDLRGHGRTLNPKDHILYYDLALDVVAFMEVLGLPSAHFCGFSMGGMFLTFIALEHASLIRSLVYASATYTFDRRVKTVVREAAAEAADDWLDSLRQAHEEYQGPGYSKTILELWVESTLREGELPFTPADLSRIDLPTLIIHGDRDPFFPVDVSITMYQSIPNSELCIVPQSGHIINNDSPELFKAALLQFLLRQI